MSSLSKSGMSSSGGGAPAAVCCFACCSACVACPCCPRLPPGLAVLALITLSAITVYPLLVHKRRLALNAQYRPFLLLHSAPLLVNYDDRASCILTSPVLFRLSIKKKCLRLATLKFYLSTIGVKTIPGSFPLLGCSSPPPVRSPAQNAHRSSSAVWWHVPIFAVA